MATATKARTLHTGRRKNAIARVRIAPGTGVITINQRPIDEYFGRETSKMILRQAFDVIEQKDKFDVFATATGGGLSGQAGAVKHGIAQALSRYEPALRTAVKQAGFLTRDPRVVERKKYGRAKARRRFQFSKR